MDTQELLSAIQKMIEASEERTNKRIEASEERTKEEIRIQIAASEERTSKRIEASEERTNKRIEASEERTNKRSEASEERTNQKIDDRFNQVMAYIESDVMKGIKTIAEGHQMLVGKFSVIDELRDEIQEIKGSIVAVEAAVVKNQSNIIDLQKAKR